MTISNFVAYVKQAWKNKPDTSTPLSAPRLLHMEDGIKMTSDAIEKIAAAVVSQIVNDPDKIASMAALYAVNQKIGDVANLPNGAADVVTAITQQNSNLNNKAPESHASSKNIYGKGSASNFGHLKISDNYTSSKGNASEGVAASSKALNDVYNVTLKKVDKYIVNRDTDLTVPDGVYILILKHNSAPNGNGMYLYATETSNLFPIKEALDVTFQCIRTKIRFTCTYNPTLTALNIS